MKKLIIGLDLSFGSTGITISFLEDNIGKSIEFNRVIFDNRSRKNQYKPKEFKNVNNHTYSYSLDLNEFVIDSEDVNNSEQVDVTLKAMKSSQMTCNIVKKAIEKHNPEEIYVCIENFIMPDFGGKNQLKVVSGLIMLQGFVRSTLIQMSLSKKIRLKLLTPTPSTIKASFCKNGAADKELMLKEFLTNYDGDKLIPGLSIADLHHINDVIDSFALMYYCYGKLLKYDEEMISL